MCDRVILLLYIQVMPVLRQSNENLTEASKASKKPPRSSSRDNKNGIRSSKSSTLFEATGSSRPSSSGLSSASIPRGLHKAGGDCSDEEDLESTPIGSGGNDPSAPTAPMSSAGAKESKSKKKKAKTKKNGGESS